MAEITNGFFPALEAQGGLCFVQTDWTMVRTDLALLTCRLKCKTGDYPLLPGIYREGLPQDIRKLRLAGE